ncbi:MAG: DUF4325 domain-containing protein [Bacteroidota bacterium]
MRTRSTRQQKEAIKKFIIDNIGNHPTTITQALTATFNISRQAAHKYLSILVKENILESSGTTKNKKYSLKENKKSFKIVINDKVKEDLVWRNEVMPELSAIPDNIFKICEYGFTEILNNAIDHSEGKEIIISVKTTIKEIQMVIFDDGIGIFNKIDKALNLGDPRFAILELAKGKFTTEPLKHTGEGIFFTSRSFDHFTISSGNLFFSHSSIKDDWLIETEEPIVGTLVVMKISKDSPRDLQNIFNEFSSPEKHDYGFSKTHIPVSLVKYGEENLVSRSQAKRLLTRFERFKEVFLDFKGVTNIGQAFADEIFRVFALQNPQTKIIWINENEQVGNMIARAIQAKNEIQK